MTEPEELQCDGTDCVEQAGDGYRFCSAQCFIEEAVKDPHVRKALMKEALEAVEASLEATKKGAQERFMAVPGFFEQCHHHEIVRACQVVLPAIRRLIKDHT